MTRRSLRFEQLERRLLLAGDVKVAVSRGDLIVTGDQNPAAGVDETVQIASLGGGAYRVTGSAGTQLVYNGQTGLEFDVPGVTRDVIVDMKTGTDSVTVLMDSAHLPLPRNLKIKGGTGIDVITVEGGEITGAMTLDGGSEDNTLEVTDTIVAKNVSLKGLAGVDTLTLGQVEFRGKLTVDTGAGNDQLTINGGGIVKDVAKDVSVKTGDGDDAVTLTGGDFGGKLTIDSGAGNDKNVTLDGGQVAKDVSIKTGEGDDVVEIIDGNLLGKLTINAGNGENVVTIDPTMVTKNVSITTGSGPDGVWLEEVELGLKAKLTISTGSGNDRVGLLDSTVPGNISISTGNNNDQVGLVRVHTDASITVKAGNGAYQNADDKGDRIGLAGVTAVKNVTLDGGSAGTRGPWGASEVGVTGSKIDGNLTIKTGNAPDAVGIGDGDEIIGTMQAFLVDLNDDPIDFSDATGKVHVDNGIVSINTGKYSDPKGDSDDWVVVDNASAKIFRLTTGKGNDNAKIVGDVAATQEVSVKMLEGDDWLTLAVDVAEFPAKALVDGGAGGFDTLETPNPEIVDLFPKVFKDSWENPIKLVI